MKKEKKLRCMVGEGGGEGGREGSTHSDGHCAKACTVLRDGVFLGDL